MKTKLQKQKSLTAKASETGGMEGARSATGIPPVSGNRKFSASKAPDPEVTEKRLRRKFTAAYKLRILEEADKCDQYGQIGVLLRREGLYDSHLYKWRKQRKQGILQGVAPKKRGRKPNATNPLSQRVAQLEKENRRLRQQLKKAEIIIDTQKKISELLSLDQDLNERSD